MSVPHTQALPFIVQLLSRRDESASGVNSTVLNAMTALKPNSVKARNLDLDYTLGYQAENQPPSNYSKLYHT